MSPQGLIPFAIVLETPPMQNRHWWSYLETYFQDAGAFALLGLWIWIIAALVRAFAPARGQARAGVPLFLLVVGVVALGLYAIGGVSGLVIQAREGGLYAPVDPTQSTARGRWWDYFLSAGGFVALLGVFVPFLIDSRQLSLRRIWALTKLSFLETVRRRILWVFLIFMLLFLFPPKWFVLIKPENEVKANLNLIHFGTTAILLLTATALASFSIPTDIRNQTIHTIVTKPVEKFEIVIGRFLGYLGLTTMVMLGVFAIGLALLYTSGVDPDARRESMKSDVPVFGELGFLQSSRAYEGESVGREWEYRRYIPGGPASQFRAAWYFLDGEMDTSLANLDVVRCEFKFDIFRTTKGEENKAVECTFFVMTHTAKKNIEEVVQTYRARIKGRELFDPEGSDAEKANWREVSKIAGELGYYEYPSKKVADYHIESIPIPGSLFARSLEGEPEKDIEILGRGKVGARVAVMTRCDTRTQFIGVAKYDLYLLAAQGSFVANFFKGALGLWMRLCLVIGIAVTCSTYLNGVVSFLVTAVLTVLGFFKPFVIFMATQLAQDMPNPGPADSMRKLITNESLGASPDATNPTHKVTQAADEGFRWGVRRVISLIPPIDRLTWENYVANGISVPFQDLTWNFLGVLGYLSIWAVLGHYLMKWREIATW